MKRLVAFIALFFALAGVADAQIRFRKQQQHSLTMYTDGTHTATGTFTFTGGPFAFNDDAFVVRDNSDTTKQAQFQVSGLTTATTRTYTFPDQSSTIAVTGNNLSVFASTTSAQLAGVISDETGSGALVFGTSPTFATSATFPGPGIWTATAVGMGTASPVRDLHISSAAPDIMLAETGVTADNGRWDIQVDAEALSFRVVNDADSVATAWLTVNRTGTTVDTVDITGLVGITAASAVDAALSLKNSAGTTVLNIASVSGWVGSGSVTDTAFGAIGSNMNFYTNSSTTLRMAISSGGIIGMGTTVVTSAGAGDVVLTNAAGEIRHVNAAANDTYASVIMDASDDIIYGNTTTPQRIRTSLGTPGNLGNGDWWAECSGTTPNRVCSLNIYDGSATRILAQIVY